MFRNHPNDLYLMTVEDGDEGGGSTRGETPREEPQEDKGFPTETAVADMTPEQQTAYWRDKAQKHERLWKEVKASEGYKNAGAYKKVKAELDELKQATLSDAERAVDAARSEGETAGEARAAQRYQRKIVAAELQLATGQSADALKYLDHTAFLTDAGEVDADKVTEYAELHGASKTQDKRSDSWVIDAGKRGTHDGGTPSVKSGRERYLARVTKQQN